MRSEWTPRRAGDITFDFQEDETVCLVELSLAGHKVAHIASMCHSKTMRDPLTRFNALGIKLTSTAMGSRRRGGFRELWDLRMRAFASLDRCCLSIRQVTWSGLFALHPAVTEYVSFPFAMSPQGGRVG